MADDNFAVHALDNMSECDGKEDGTGCTLTCSDGTTRAGHCLAGSGCVPNSGEAPCYDYSSCFWRCEDDGTTPLNCDPANCGGDYYCQEPDGGCAAYLGNPDRPAHMDYSTCACEWDCTPGDKDHTADENGHDVPCTYDDTCVCQPDCAYDAGCDAEDEHGVSVAGRYDSNCICQPRCTYATPCVKDCGGGRKVDGILGADCTTCIADCGSASSADSASAASASASYASASDPCPECTAIGFPCGCMDSVSISGSASDPCPPNAPSPEFVEWCASEGGTVIRGVDCMWVCDTGSGDPGAADSASATASASASASDQSDSGSGASASASDQSDSEGNASRSEASVASWLSAIEASALSADVSTSIAELSTASKVVHDAASQAAASTASAESATGASFSDAAASYQSVLSRLDVLQSLVNSVASAANDGSGNVNITERDWAASAAASLSNMQSAASDGLASTESAASAFSASADGTASEDAAASAAAASALASYQEESAASADSKQEAEAASEVSRAEAEASRSASEAAAQSLSELYASATASEISAWEASLQSVISQGEADHLSQISAWEASLQSAVSKLDADSLSESTVYASQSTVYASQSTVYASQSTADAASLASQSVANDPCSQENQNACIDGGGIVIAVIDVDGRETCACDHGESASLAAESASTASTWSALQESYASAWASNDASTMSAAQASADSIVSAAESRASAVSASAASALSAVSASLDGLDDSAADSAVASILSADPCVGVTCAGCGTPVAYGNVCICQCGGCPSVDDDGNDIARDPATCAQLQSGGRRPGRNEYTNAETGLYNPAGDFATNWGEIPTAYA